MERRENPSDSSEFSDLSDPTDAQARNWAEDDRTNASSPSSNGNASLIEEMMHENQRHDERLVSAVAEDGTDHDVNALPERDFFFDSLRYFRYFRNVKSVCRAPENLSAIAFTCGIVAGGGINTCCSAFGLLFGLALLNPPYRLEINAAICLFYFFCMHAFACGNVLSFAHLGIVCEDFIRSERLTPLMSMKMTLAFVSVVSPSLAVHLFVILVHCLEVVPPEVR